MVKVSRMHQHCETSSEKSARRRPGRPHKPAAQLAAVKKRTVLNALRMHHARRQMHTASTHNKLSELEKLPAELIQHIFFQSLEVNLPRASPHLQQVLSTEAIFHALVAFAYFDDDGSNPVEKKHFLPAAYRVLTCEEKVRLQQGICSCRWFSLHRLEICLAALSRLSIVQAWHSEHLQDQSYERVATRKERIDQRLPFVANQTVRGLAPLPALDEEAKLEEHFLVRTNIQELGSTQSFDDKGTKLLPRIITWSSLVDKHGEFHKHTNRSLSTLAARHIPNWLLHRAQWTDDELSLLKLLRQGYTFIQTDHVMKISAKTLFEGMRSAIRLANVDVLLALVEIHNAFLKSDSREAYHTSTVQRTPQLTPQSNHPLPIDLFHLAVGQHSNTTELLSLLLRAGIDALSRDDDIVTSWAVHESQQHNSLAVWLLNHMEGTADYGLPPFGHLFVDGCLSWRARGSFPFPNISFATELGYLAGTPTVPTGLHGKGCGFESD